MSGTPWKPDDSTRRRLAILTFALAAFIALTIAGLGFVSLLTDEDVIAAEGLGQAPGIAGVVVAAAAWAGVTGPSLSRRPGIGTAVFAGLAAAAGYVVAVFAGVVVTGADVAVAASVAARLVVAGFAPVVAVAGLLAATGAAVAVRTAPGAARWPWERDDDE